MNTDAIIFLLTDFKNMPAAQTPEVFSEKAITAYVSKYPDVCQAYIKEACEVEVNQLPINHENPLTANQPISTSSNAIIAATYAILSVYPDGVRWQVKDLFKVLSLVKFDAALYLFALFYGKHNNNYKFYLDIKNHLNSANELNDIPFIKHIYNLCRLFTINEVNDIQHTDIINKEFNNANETIV